MRPKGFGLEREPLLLEFGVQREHRRTIVRGGNDNFRLRPVFYGVEPGGECSSALHCSDRLQCSKTRLRSLADEYKRHVKIFQGNTPSRVLKLERPRCRRELRARLAIRDRREEEPHPDQPARGLAHRLSKPARA